MAIKVITVGKKHELWVSPGINRYQKRLIKPFNVEWVILPNSTQKGPSARKEESQSILSRISAYDYVILLDERGLPLDSKGLSNLLLKPIRSSQHVVLVIGGAYGVDDSVRQRANFVWSLSDLVFPHQLVRLILTEQIYRAQEISSGKPYHHE